MTVHVFDHSFSAGELTPELYSRVDSTMFSEGLALCRNFITLPHGPAINRPGFAYVSTTKNSANLTRLIPFTYNATQTFAIELGAGYFRWHSLGATLGYSITAPWSSTTAYLPNDLAYYGGVTYSCLAANTNSAPPGANWRTTAWGSGYAYAVGDLVAVGTAVYYCILANTNQTPPNATYWYALPASAYEIPNNYAAADLMSIRFMQSADTLTLVHQNYPPMELRRYGATNWQFTQPSFNPPTNCPTGVSATSKVVTVGNPNNYQYVVTSLTPVTLQESVASAASIGPSVTLTAATKANPGVFTSVAHGLIVGNTVTITGVVGMTQLNGNTYTVNTVPTADTFTLAASGTPLDTTGFTAYTSGGSVQLLGANIDMSQAGNKITITWTAPSGTAPVRYNVYRLYQGLFSYIGQAGGTSFVDQNIIANSANTPPTYDATFASATNYPAAVSYYQQRRVFASTATSPQNLWMTKSGTDSDMSYSIPTRDSDRIAIRIAAREASAIMHIVPVAELLLLTASCEWACTAASGGAITPSTINVAPQSYNGANNATPQVVGNMVLYGSARGGHIRELTYSWQQGGYIAQDISLSAPHLFDYKTISDMAFSRGPIPILWAVSSTGNLLGMTYVPEQKVNAWHHHNTGTTDAFESLCVITEEGEDMLYVVVNRTLNGVQTRTVERLHTRNYATLADAFYVDCGLTYNGAPATVISGLTWLIGMTVNILADGAVSPPQVVDNTGSITLPYAASKVTVGLPITSQIQTLPVDAQVDSGLSQGRPKNVNKAWLRVYRSSGIHVGPSLSALQMYAQRTTESYGTAPAMVSDEVTLTLSPSWGKNGQIFVQQTDPLPLDIASIAMEVVMGG